MEKLSLLVVGFGVPNVLVFALFTDLDTFKIVSDLIGKVERNHILRVEVDKKFGKDATIWPWLRSTSFLAFVTEPFTLWRLVLIHRRINASEVESAPAAIATK